MFKKVKYRGYSVILLGNYRRCSIFAPSYQQVATLFAAKVNKKAERHNGNIKKK